MRYILSLLLLLTSSYGFAQECKSPNIELGLKKIFNDDLPWDYTVLRYTSFSPQIQWVGLYWQGPISGALMAYDCNGKFLSGVKTGGIETLDSFYGPKTIKPTIVIEEKYTGTGIYTIGYGVYTIKNGKIKEIWHHIKRESVFVIPSEDGHVDIFEIQPAGPTPDDYGDKLRVEGIRKIYPVVKDSSSDYRLEKLPTKYYCWSKDKETYVQCK